MFSNSVFCIKFKKNVCSTTGFFRSQFLRFDDFKVSGNRFQYWFFFFKFRFQFRIKVPCNSTVYGLWNHSFNNLSKTVQNLSFIVIIIISNLAKHRMIRCKNVKVDRETDYSFVIIIITMPYASLAYSPMGAMWPSCTACRRKFVPRRAHTELSR